MSMQGMWTICGRLKNCSNITPGHVMLCNECSNLHMVLYAFVVQVFVSKFCLCNFLRFFKSLSPSLLEIKM